jgi:hypothetical protein
VVKNSRPKLFLILKKQRKGNPPTKSIVELNEMARSFTKLSHKRVVGLSREADERKWKCDCLTEPKRKNWATAHVKMLQCLG